VIAAAAAVQNADAEADARWQAWQIRGGVADRERAATIRVLMTGVALILAGWLLFVLG
jgi:hypothetical protein